MNTQLFIYALEVQKTGSITQAAGNMFMSQPTLSKAIKELEQSLGFSVFERSSKGVVPTQKGREFLLHARKIVDQMQRMEQSLAAQDGVCQHFSLAIPRVSYIARAAAEQACAFDGSRMEIDLLETSSAKAAEAVAYGHYALGVVRCRVEDEDYFIGSLDRKGLQHELIWRGQYVALMRGDHPLAQQPVELEAFGQYIEVVFGDEETCGLGGCMVAPSGSRRILVYDRAMQMEILCRNPLAYMWVSPMPQDALPADALVQCRCAGGGEFSDLLISKKDYHFSAADRAFIDRLYLQRNKAAYSIRGMLK